MTRWRLRALPDPETTKGAPTLAAPEESQSVGTPSQRPARDPSEIVIIIGGRLDRADAVRLGTHARALLEHGGAELLVCDVGALIKPDAVVIDALCRMRLAARRLGCQLALRDASSHLGELLALVGLTDVMRLAAGQDSG